MRILKLWLFFFILCLSGFVSSNEETADINPLVPDIDFAKQVVNADDMEKLLKENKRCIRCHKVERKLKNIAAVKMLGAHASEKFYDNCSACHGDKGKHPKEDFTIISFAADTHTPLALQNSQCMICHTPLQLRKTEWTHDVHYKQISCAACHQLHDAQDPIINISRRSRIKLCVDCHLAINDLQGEQ